MYKEDVNIVFRYMEICVNVGYAAGPIIGAVVYQGLKYNGTMFLFGGINGLCLIFCIFMIPNSVNETKFRGDLSHLEEIDKEASIRNIRKDVTWCDFYSNKSANISMLTMVFGLYGTMFFSSFLGNELIHDYEMDGELSGYLLGLQCVTYIFMCWIYPKNIKGFVL